MTAHPDPHLPGWEWRSVDGTIQGRPTGGAWAVIGEPGVGTMHHGQYVGASTPERMALWVKLQGGK